MKELKIPAIDEGTVIDHIPSEKTPKVVDILSLTGFKEVISIAMNLYSEKIGKKGIIKISKRNLTKEEVDKIAIIAPNATVNLIGNFEVKKKIEVNIPDIIHKIIKCSNPNCITNREDADTRFLVLSKNPLKLRCHYCERCMAEKDIMII